VLQVGRASTGRGEPGRNKARRGGREGGGIAVYVPVQAPRGSGRRVRQGRSGTTWSFTGSPGISPAQKVAVHRGSCGKGFVKFLKRFSNRQRLRHEPWDFHRHAAFSSERGPTL